MLAVQASWLHNFYLQKTDEFQRSVYDAMDEIGTKLRDRKNIESLKMTYLIENGDTLVKTPARNRIVVEAEDNVEISNMDPGGVIVRELTRPRQAKDGKDPIVITHKNKNTHISFSSNSTHVTMNSSIESPVPPRPPVPPDLLDPLSSMDVKKVVEKMMTEIIVLDTETRDPDTVRSLIKHSLENRGVFMPFEFSLQQVQKSKSPTILATSKNYKPAKDDFKSDLSGDKIIPTRDVLFLQFQKQNDFVMAGMKGSIGLSLFLSLLIFSVLYYVLHIIRQQKKLSDIKNDFVNNMTHELKTPIATISLALDAVTNPLIKNDDEKFKEYTRILKEENRKLDKHVERVLQTALLEKGELQLSKRSILLNDLLRSVVNSFQLQITEQKVQVELDVNEDIFVHADEQHLRAVFVNLLDNALKYSGEKCLVKIIVRKEANKAIVKFRDNGIGIDEANQRRIFEKFYRVQSGNLHDVKGFGLGLSYVKSIVEAHGGHIEVKSELGKGSEFCLVLSI